MNDAEALRPVRPAKPDADLVGFREVAKAIEKAGTAVQEFPANVRAQLRLVEMAYYSGCGTGVLGGLVLAVLYAKLFGGRK